MPYPAPGFATPADAPRSEDPDLVLALHRALTGREFTVARVGEELGDRAMAAWQREQPTPARLELERVRRARPHLATLIALFLLGDPVPGPAVDAALPGVGAAGLQRLGLLEPAASPDDAAGHGTVRTTMDLRPYATDVTGELYVVSDLGAFQRPGVLRRDHVLGIGGASLTLVRCTERREVPAALDIGTGCGIQTFHLLAHARHVTATDLSERALATARFNLILNARALDVDPYRPERRVSLLRGSLLEPVAGREFDLVVSNPPFVITPRGPGEDASERFSYRDGGMSGDRLVRELFGALPEVMAPGATAHLLANWEIPESPGELPEQTWSRRVREWIGPGIGAWVIQRELQDPCEYAEMWLQDAAQQREQGEYEREYERYLRDFASRSVAAVGFGMVRLSRPAEPLPEEAIARVFEDVPHPIQQPIAPTLEVQWRSKQAVWREEVLASAPGRHEWRDRHYTVAEDVTEERHGRPGAQDPALIVLRQGAGLRRTVVVSSEAAGFTGACDGELSARQILTALGALLGWGEGPDPRLEREIRSLVADGFLIEVSD